MPLRRGRTARTVALLGLAFLLLNYVGPVATALAHTRTPGLPGLPTPTFAFPSFAVPKGAKPAGTHGAR